MQQKRSRSRAPINFCKYIYRFFIFCGVPRS